MQDNDFCVTHNQKNGSQNETWFVCCFPQTWGLTMRGHIIFESVLSLLLVQPLLPTGVEGLQSAFHLSQCRAIALTLASTVGELLH